MTPRKAKPAKDAPEAQATPNVDAAPVVKQATPAKQEGPEPGPALAYAPPVAPEVDKGKRVKPKPAALPLAPVSLTDTMTEQHDQLMTITKATDSLDSLYEYTRKNFCMLTEQLTQLQCKEHQEFEFLT